MAGNKELIEALEQIEKEKDISKDILLEAIENSLVAACKNHFGKADNIKVNINKENGAFSVYAEREVVEEVTDPVIQISLEEAANKYPKKKFAVGDIVQVEVTPRNFGRIAAQKAKQVVVQKIREEERKVLYNQYCSKEKEVVTGIVQRYTGPNININLGKVDAVLPENEQIKTEHFVMTERIKVYVVEVKDTTKGPKITVSRTHKELVKRLFEEEVTEVREGVVEIRSIAREAGARTKMAVSTNDPNVDPVGACVGLNGARVNAIVNELRGEKIDIINWSDNPEELIENALSPAKVISVEVSEEERSARVIVPDYQLSLAIGKEGQNARLAARLTGYKIDIKSESQSGTYNDGSYQDNYGYNGGYQDGYGGYGYQDGSYQGGYDGSYEEGGYAEGGYDGSYEEGGYAEDGYDGSYEEDGYAEGGYDGSYEEDGYAEDGYDGSYEEDGYAEDGYDGGCEEGGYAEDGYDGGCQEGSVEPGVDNAGEEAAGSAVSGKGKGKRKK